MKRFSIFLITVVFLLTAVCVYGQDTNTDTDKEGETGILLDDGIDTYSGNWVEEIAGRGYMEIEPSGNGKYYITVTWGNSAAEKASWKFTAIYDSESGDLVYDDGQFQEIQFKEDGSDEVMEEKSVQGKLHYEDGKLLWTDNAYESDEPSVFVSEEDRAEMLKEKDSETKEKNEKPEDEDSETKRTKKPEDEDSETKRTK